MLRTMHQWAATEAQAEKGDAVLTPARPKTGTGSGAVAAAGNDRGQGDASATATLGRLQTTTTGEAPSCAIEEEGERWHRGEEPDGEEKRKDMMQLVEMGFSREQALLALRVNSGQVCHATPSLGRFQKLFHDIAHDMDQLSCTKCGSRLPQFTRS